MENMVSNDEGRTDQFPVGMRVLAVDDSQPCLRRLEELLLRCKYHVTKTMESKKALELLREKSNMFDLVISDVEMPDADGFKLLEIGLEMDLPVIMLSSHSDYNSVMKGIIHGACDYIVKPVNLKELQNIWQHVVKKNIGSYKKIIGGGPSRQLLPSSDSAPSATRKRKEKVEDDSGDGDDSDRDEEDGDGSEQDGEESSTRKKPRVVWTQDLHQKFVHAVQQLGLDKAVPKKILDFMNIEGLTRENVASHLQKYRLYLKKLDEGQPHNMGQDAFGSRDSSYFHMAQLEGLRDYTSTRQLSSSSLLARSTLTKFHPSVYSSINSSSSFISQGLHQSSSNSANPFGTYQSPLLSRSNVNLSPLDPLQFPRNKCPPYMGTSFLDSRMSFGISTSTSLPSASSNNLMMQQESFNHNLHGVSDGNNQSCLDGSMSNSNGLSSFPSWQGNLQTTTRFPSNSLPMMNHGFGQEQVNGLGDYNTSLVSSDNHVGAMQCEPPPLLGGDFTMLNNTFGNVDYPLVPVDNNMVFRDNVGPIDESATSLNSRECVGNVTMMDPEMRPGKLENDNDVFADIMNEMFKQDENNGMMSGAARFGFDSFPPP